jgi:DNA-binding MarR family transcriptional regulator/N-acetylglutamate synthase-like GNAT family acetyltransferase
MADGRRDQRVEVVRKFNRFYTQQIGALHEGLLESPFSLTEVRVLYELANRQQPTASDLSKDLALDAGYLSRILRNFEKRGLIKRTQSRSDGRQSLLTLTALGHRTFAPLNARSHDDVAAMLKGLSSSGQNRLIEAMRSIERLLNASPENSRVPYILRPHQPGDIGWIVHRHGVLYGEEYGWDERFEALVAQVAASFIENFDPKRERCWIAERDGDIVGSVMLVKKSKTVAKLRLLLVEPTARGLGIGKRLVEECVRFARQAGYRKFTLWTQSILGAARHIYKEAGFELVHEEPHHSFGHDLVSETWEMKL